MQQYRRPPNRREASYVRILTNHQQQQQQSHINERQIKGQQRTRQIRGLVCQSPAAPPTTQQRPRQMRGLACTHPNHPIIDTSYQKLPFGSGDYPDKLLFHQALKFLTHQTGDYPVTCFVSKPSRITLVELSHWNKHQHQIHTITNHHQHHPQHSE